ncbi:unnamed protein product [Coffea canephora]|uniref:RRM domain-containing protein n=2 Tax=Coffea TaxID=13442 RepID=A0A068UEM7_COFCA|nr:organelle RRM domain-containing protein 2, mitochondrial-like [Coffea arabica]CDP06644.1 unnamed protein product [Coffea canephora]
MAIASGFRRILSLASSTNSSSSSIRPCLLASTRLHSTLTSPKLFISGLSRTTNDEALNNAFSQFGKPVEVKVITDRATGRSKGFGFVTYETIEEAEKARQEMSGKFLDGWVIFVDPAKPREPRPPPPAQSQGQPSQPGYTVNRTIGWCG